MFTEKVSTALCIGYLRKYHNPRSGMRSGKQGEFLRSCHTNNSLAYYLSASNFCSLLPVGATQK